MIVPLLDENNRDGMVIMLNSLYEQYEWEERPVCYQMEEGDIDGEVMAIDRYIGVCYRGKHIETGVYVKVTITRELG